MLQYQDLLRKIVASDASAEYRNGVRTSAFNQHLEFDLREGFPLVTIKKTNANRSFDEMLMFIRGDCNIKNMTYPDTWAPWALEKDYPDNPTYATKGDIGAIYGREYRYATNSHVPIRQLYYKSPEFGIAPDVDATLRLRHGDDFYDANKRDIQYDYVSRHVDQLWELVQGLKINPHSTRHRIAVYSPEYRPDESLTPKVNVLRGKGALTACNVFQQYTVRKIDGKLHVSLHITQASSDALIGLPHNIAQFAMLLSVIAKEVDMVPHMLYINIGDAHIYNNQINTTDDLSILCRKPKALSQLLIAPDASIWDLKLDDLRIVNYMSYPFMKFNVEV